MPGFLSRGVVRAIRMLRRESLVWFHHLGACRTARKYRSHKDLKLNLGSGPNRKPGWINIDIGPSADLRLDLRERIPLPDGSCASIYSEHFFEHLLYPHDAFFLLRECFRLLHADGEMTVGVPDTTWPILEYASNSNEYFERAKRNWHPAWCETRLDHINYHFRQDGEHLFAYDEETLANALRKVGFTNVFRRDFDPSSDCVSRKDGTLYMVARKPLY